VSWDEPGGCPSIGQVVSGMEATWTWPAAPERNGRRRAPKQSPPVTWVCRWWWEGVQLLWRWALVDRLVVAAMFL